MTFAIGGMSFWRPAYFCEQRGQADLERMNLIFGGITAIAGLSAPCLEAGSGLVAFAVAIFIMHALGDAISPPLIGAVPDRWNLDIGFLVVSFMMVIAGLLWLAGAKFLGPDVAKAACG